MTTPRYRSAAQYNDLFLGGLSGGTQQVPADATIAVDTLNQLESIANSSGNGVQINSLTNTTIAVTGGGIAAALGAAFSGKNIIAIVGEDANGNPVAVNTLLAAIAFTGSGTFNDKMCLLTAMGNFLLTGQGSLPLAGLSAANDIVINFVAASGLVNIHVYAQTPLV